MWQKRSLAKHFYGTQLVEVLSIKNQVKNGFFDGRAKWSSQDELSAKKTLLTTACQ